MRANVEAMTRGVLSVLLALLLSTALAAEEGEKAQREPPQIGAAAGKVINDAIELLNANNLSGAKQTISKLDPADLSPYERSRVEQILASIDHQQENFAGARAHLVAALDAGGLEPPEALQVRFQIAQLLLSEENWKAGAAALEEWFTLAEKPNASAYYMLAMAYYQQEDYQRAMAPAAKAVELTDKPQKSWTELLLAVYLNLEKWELATPLVMQQIREAPDTRSHWLQLASVYSQQNRFDRAMVVMQLMEQAGLLTEPADYTRLADQLMFAKVPHRAARLLTTAIEQKKLEASAEIYQKLANAWLTAREYGKAVDPLERAFTMTDDGNIGLRIAEIQLQRNDWPAAAAAAQRALDKGGLKDRGSAELVLGIALYNQHELDSAREVFERAAQSPAQRKYARSYLQAIDARRSQL